MKIWIVVLAAATAAALLASRSTAYLLPDPGQGQVQILRNDASRIGVRNQHGEWWIAKRCVSGRKRVGPGYVYLVKRKGKVVVDDLGQADPRRPQWGSESVRLVRRPRLVRLPARQGRAALPVRP